MVGLVKERLKWETEYNLGEPCTFKAFLDYKEQRLSEMFRLPREMEKFFSYVIILEHKVAEMKNNVED